MAYPDSLTEKLEGGGSISRQPLVTPDQAGLMGDYQKFALAKAQNPSAGFEPIRQQIAATQQRQRAQDLQQMTSGGHSALSSPAFASQLAAGNNQFNTNLGALESQYALQNEQLGLQYGDRALNRQFENIIQPSAWNQFNQGVAKTGTEVVGKVGEKLVDKFGNWISDKLTGGGGDKKEETSTTSDIAKGVTEGAITGAVGEGLKYAGNKALDVLKGGGDLATKNPALASTLLTKAGEMAGSTAGTAATAAAAGGIGAKLAGLGGTIAAGASAALPVLLPVLGGLATVGGFTYMLYRLFEDDWI